MSTRVVTLTPKCELAWADANLRPLWENERAHNDAKRIPAPMLWAWERMVPFVDHAATLVSTQVTERRVLSLTDPQYSDNGAATVRNLNGGLQILMPGESARPHRHSMNAIRFVLEGEGAITTVDGARCPMARGDLIVTPAWTWHEHVHPGDARIVWLDVLDAQLHRFLETDAFQPGPVPRDAALDDSPAAVARFRFPWEAAAAAVTARPREADGLRLYRYRTTAAATLACSLWQLDRHESTASVITDQHAVCAVVEGTGVTTVGDTRMQWGPNDVFSLPKGARVSHRANDDAVRMFVVGDGALLREVEGIAGC